MIEEYLTGRLVARVRAEIPDGAVGAPGMRPRTRLRLYCSEDDQELMFSGDKDVEARVGVGTAAAVREGAPDPARRHQGARSGSEALCRRG